MKSSRRLQLLALVAAAAVCGGCSDPAHPDPDDNGYPYPVGKVFFTHLPIGTDGVYFWESMGALLTPYPQDHGAFHHIEMEPGENTIPVIAPSDGQVTELRTGTGYDGTVEHAVRFQASTTIELLWGHVGRLVDPLASQAPPIGGSRNVEIPVEAGDTIAYVANTPLDLAVNDSTYAAAILHPEFYGPNALAAPLEDYYREPLKSQLLALTLREVEPRTGVMGYDVAGTLSGLWYLVGSDPRPEFRFDWAFQFGYHHLQGHRATIIDGWAFSRVQLGDLIDYSFWIKGNPRMEDITPSSGRVKFEMYMSRFGVSGTPPDLMLQDISGLDDEVQTTTILLVEMLDAETVRVERFDASGISPDDVAGFTENARTYVRNPVG